MSAYRPTDKRWRGGGCQRPYNHQRRWENNGHHSNRSPLCRGCDNGVISGKERCDSWGSSSCHSHSTAQEAWGQEVIRRFPSDDRRPQLCKSIDLNNNSRVLNKQICCNRTDKPNNQSPLVANNSSSGCQVKPVATITEGNVGTNTGNGGASVAGFIPRTSENANHSLKKDSSINEVSMTTERHLLSGSDLEDDAGSSLLDFDFDEEDAKSNNGSSSPKITKRVRINGCFSQSSGVEEMKPKVNENSSLRSMSLKKQEVNFQQNNGDFLYLSEILDKDFVDLEGKPAVESSLNELGTNHQKPNTGNETLGSKCVSKPKSCLKKLNKRAVKSKSQTRKPLKRPGSATKKTTKKRKSQEMRSLVVKAETIEETEDAANNSVHFMPLTEKPCPTKHKIVIEKTESQVTLATDKMPSQKKNFVDLSTNQFMSDSEIPETIVIDSEEEVINQLMEEQKYHIEQIKKKNLNTLHGNIKQTTNSDNKNEEQSTQNQSGVSLQALDCEYEWLNMYAPEEDSVSLYAMEKLPESSSESGESESQTAIQTTSKEAPLPENIKKSVDLINVLLDFETQSQTQMAAETFFQIFVGSKDGMQHNNVIAVTRRLSFCLKKFEQFEYLEKLVALTVELSITLDEDVYVTLFKNVHQNQNSQFESLIKQLEERQLVSSELAKKIHDLFNVSSSNSSVSNQQLNDEEEEDLRHDVSADEEDCDEDKQVENAQSPSQDTDNTMTRQREDSLSETFLQSHRILQTSDKRGTQGDKIVVDCVFSPEKSLNEESAETHKNRTENSVPEVEGQTKTCENKINLEQKKKQQTGLLPTPGISANRNLLPNVTCGKNGHWWNLNGKDPRMQCNGSTARNLSMWGKGNRRTINESCEAYDPANPSITGTRRRPLSPRQPCTNGTKGFHPIVNKKSNNVKNNELDWGSLGHNFGELVSTITSPSNEDNVMLIFLEAMLDGKLKSSPNFALFVLGAKQTGTNKYPASLPTIEKCLSRIAVSLVYQCNQMLAYGMIQYMRKTKLNYTSHLPVNIVKTNPCTIAIRFLNVCLERCDYALASDIAADFFVNNKSMAIGPIQGQTISSMLEGVAQYCVVKKMFIPAVKFLQSIPILHCTGREVKILQEVLICLLQVDSQQFDLARTVSDLLLQRKQLLSMRVIFNNSPINKITLSFYKHLEDKGIYCCPRIAQRPHLVFIPYTMGRSEMILTLYRHFTELSLFLVDIKQRLRPNLPLRIVLLRNDVGHLHPMIPNKPPAEQYARASDLLKEVLMQIMMPTLQIQTITKVQTTNEFMFNIHISSVREWLIKNTEYKEFNK